MENRNMENEAQQQVVTEDNLIDYIFFAFYTNLDKNELHLENEILAPTKLELEPKQIEHLRELIVSTGLIKASVGFGKSGYFYLTMQGIQIMKIYKTYSAYVAAMPGQQIIHNATQQYVNNTSEGTPPPQNEEPLHFNEDDQAS